MYVRRYVYVCVCMYVRRYVYVCVCMYVGMFMYVCVCMHNMSGWTDGRTDARKVIKVNV
jgi:hypothetical protein